MEFEGLTRGLTARAVPEDIDIPAGDSASVTIIFNASADAELLRATYRINFLFHEGVEKSIAQVNITINYSPGTGPKPTNGDDDDDGGLGELFGIGIAIFIGIVAAIVLAIVVVFFLVRNRRGGSKLEDSFFVDQTEPRTSDYLDDEMTTRRQPPPPPPPVAEPSGPAQWEEEVPMPVAAPVAAPVSPPVAPSAPAPGGSCPDCGNALQPLAPPDSGAYCPMCGYKTGGP